MLALIVADRHEICLIEQNVSRHQNRIIKQADGAVLLFSRLLFVLRHPLELTHPRDAIQHPGKLCVFVNV